MNLTNICTNIYCMIYYDLYTYIYTPYTFKYPNRFRFTLLYCFPNKWFGIMKIISCSSLWRVADFGWGQSIELHQLVDKASRPLATSSAGRCWFWRAVSKQHICQIWQEIQINFHFCVRWLGSRNKEHVVWDADPSDFCLQFKALASFAKPLPWTTRRAKTVVDVSSGISRLGQKNSSTKWRMSEDGRCWCSQRCWPWMIKDDYGLRWPCPCFGHFMHFRMVGKQVSLSLP